MGLLAKSNTNAYQRFENPRVPIAFHPNHKIFAKTRLCHICNMSDVSISPLGPRKLSLRWFESGMQTCPSWNLSHSTTELWTSGDVQCWQKRFLNIISSTKWGMAIWSSLGWMFGLEKNLWLRCFIIFLFGLGIAMPMWLVTWTGLAAKCSRALFSLRT